MLAQVRTRASAPGSTSTQVARRQTSPRQTRAGASARKPASPPLSPAAIDTRTVIQIQVEISLLDPRRGSIDAEHSAWAAGAAARSQAFLPGAGSRAGVGERCAERAGDAAVPLRRPGLVVGEVVDL